MDGSVLGCDRSALDHHPLVGLHQVAEVRLRHLPAVNPEAGTVERDLLAGHVLHTGLALVRLVDVEDPALDDDGAAGAAVLVPPHRVKADNSSNEGVTWEGDKVAEMGGAGKDFLQLLPSEPVHSQPVGELSLLCLHPFSWTLDSLRVFFDDRLHC